MGLDLTFSAPKSVSMQALVGSDRAVTDAHDRAVQKALEQVELLAETRKKIKGKSYRERTGNMVIGKFRHEMSRAKDPQLHTHAVVLNLTQRSDGKWRALANEDIYRVQHQIDGIYKTELAKELQTLGYAIRVVDDKGNFELDHVSRGQIEAFSERSKVIEESLANQGKTRATATALERNVIALATRKRKDKGDVDVIKQYWLAKSKECGIDYSSKAGISHQTYQLSGNQSVDTQNYKKPVQAIMEYAIKHLTERESVVRESELMATAMRRAVGLARPEEVQAEIRRLVEHGTLIKSEPTYTIANDKNSPQLTAKNWQARVQQEQNMTARDARAYVSDAIRQGSLVLTEYRYTTQTAIVREEAILSLEKSGRNQVMPILATTVVAEALKNKTLTDGQRAVVETIVSTHNRFVGVQGDAGTGKTYAVNQAREMIAKANSKIKDKRQHYRIVALAPYGNQVKALKNEGMEAHTLASFLHTRNKPIDDKTIIVLDETGVVSARQMAQVMRIVEKTNARMVMIGDTKQTEAIEAGKPFVQLQKEGMQTARLKEVQRQKTPELKLAVEQAADQNTVKSLSHVKHVEEIVNSGDRHKSIVADYMRLPEQERKTTLIICGTNKDRVEINGLLRNELKLTGKGRSFDTLTRVDMTQAQRRYAPSYQPGMVIQPDKDYAKAGLIRGETYKVKEALPGNLLVLEKPDNTTVTVNPRQTTNISVYHLERSELSVGETVRINRNDPKLDLTNGDRMIVTGVAPGIVRLESVEQKNGKPIRSLELPTNKPMHMEYGYTSTVHSSQGLTCDRVYISMDTRSRTTSMNLYYVAISRARQEARIYTNSVKELPTAIARRYSKTSALELQRERRNYAVRILVAEEFGVAQGKKDYQYNANKK